MASDRSQSMAPMAIPAATRRFSPRLGGGATPFEQRVASVDDPASLDRALAGSMAVINCAGPFARTAAPIIDAALRAGIPYLDVAAEIEANLDSFADYASDGGGLEHSFARLAATGAIGCNFEDQIVGTDRIYPIADQRDRIAGARRGAGADFFINARTDLFLKADAADYRDLVGDAIERAKAYADAGANGFFIPGLGDLALVERICTAVALPINTMHFPAAPTRSQWAAAGVARISHGSFPLLALMEQFEASAREAIG